MALEVGSVRLPLGKAGAFDRAPGPAGKPAVLLGPNPTEYEVLHELAHVEQWETLGPDAYGRLDVVAKEQFVYDRLQAEYWDLLTYEEQLHAKEYIMSLGGIP